jgi:hypothetical protein
MKRRDFIFLTTAAVFAPAIAVAGQFEDALITMLRAQGYTAFRTSKTWLGRLRITALSDTNRREIILNPRTGEVLRDFWEVIGENGESKSGLFDPEDDDDYDELGDDDDDNSGHGSGSDGDDSSSGPGSGEDEDDDDNEDEDDEDDDVEDDDDSSGPGSGKEDEPDD